MAMTDRAAYAPQSLISALPGEFRGGRQQDAFEYGKSVLACMESIQKVYVNHTSFSSLYSNVSLSHVVKPA